MLVIFSIKIQQKITNPCKSMQIHANPCISTHYRSEPGSRQTQLTYRSSSSINRANVTKGRLLKSLKKKPARHITILSLQDYQILCERKSNSIHVVLANIQGLITNRKNKCKFLRDVTKTESKHQVTVLTETWTKHNYEGEITEHFKDYNLLKVDRNLYPDSDDPYHLKTRGGTLILTSPDVTITPEPCFSNGNYEVACQTTNCELFGYQYVQAIREKLLT